ncbi:MAG: hypothetical protein GXO88_15180 [Chlorobi bacterium]|nr:hypothetical protein [Chlorobiota bacterium]
MRYILIIVAAVFISACSNPKHEKSTKTEEIHKAHDSNVTLINGQKWKVDFSTYKGVQNMKELMDGINSSSTLSDYRKLGADLQNELRNIFKTCDMTGEAHNQLHNYLHPIVAFIKELNESDLSKCKSTANSLKTHLDEYELYFK